jgi:hypothetical protein
MGKYYDQLTLPNELKRNYDVYDRIRELAIDLGTFEQNVNSLKGAGNARVIFTESGLVYLSGVAKGMHPMSDDQETVNYGKTAAREAADEHIRRLHWAITCGSEGGDLNDVLYTVKAFGMVVSANASRFTRAPEVIDEYSFRWQSVFGGGMGNFAESENNAGGFGGVHTRSAIGGFSGNFSVEPEMIVAVPQRLAIEIISNRGWIYPLPPVMLEKINGLKETSLNVGYLNPRRSKF